MTQRFRLRRSTSKSAMAAAILLGIGAATTGAVALAQQQTTTDAPKQAQQDSTQLRGNERRSGVTEEVVKPPLSLLWKFTGGAQAGNPSSAAVVGDTVYFSTGGARAQGGVVYALNSQTGAEKWRFNIPGSEAIFNTAPLLANGNVHIGASNGRMYVLKADTGREVISLNTGVAANSSPAIINDILFYGASDGRLNVLDPITGTTPKSWAEKGYKAGDSINSAPVVADSFVFFASGDQFVHALKQATGVFRWRVRMPGRFVTNPLVYADNTLYVATGSRVFAMQPASGGSRWSRNFANDIAAAPVAADGVVYVIDRDRKMYALRSNNGRDVWERDNKPYNPVLPYSPSAAPTMSGDTIYVPTARGLILALSREDGSVKWEYTLQPTTNQQNQQAQAITAITAPLTIARGSVYAVSDDGSLSAFSPSAPDNTAPVADRFYPRNGDRVSGLPPLTIAAFVSDPSSGINAKSIKIKLDDRTIVDGSKADQVPYFDGERNLVFYQTKSTGKLIDPPLPNGRHNATLTVQDWRGNEQTVSWSFIVDNSLRPASSRDAPAPRPGIGNPTRGTGGGQPAPPRRGGGGRRGGTGGGTNR